MDDERLLLRCCCGGFDFLEIGILYDMVDYTTADENIYYVTLAQEPPTFWRKLKVLFGRDNYAREVLLTKSQMEEIKDMLEKHLD